MTFKGKKHTSEWKEKIKENFKNNPNMGMKGKKFSEESRKKVSENHRRYQTEETKQKIRIKAIGRKHSEFSKNKISNSNKGKTSWNKGLKNPQEISQETRKKWSKLRKGERNPNWKGGITPINRKIRSSLEYKLWRRVVLERDNYTCIWCGKIGGILHADHIKPFSLFPELRFAIDNGRTLCVDCHRKTDTWGNNLRGNYND